MLSILKNIFCKILGLLLAKFGGGLGLVKPFRERETSWMRLREAFREEAWVGWQLKMIGSITYANELKR